MKRRLTALALAGALCLPLWTAPTTAATTGDVDEAVAVLSGLGIVSGYSDGLYHPNDGLTRAQFCKLAVLCEGHGDQVSGSAYRSLFSDVPTSSWALPYINLAHEEGLVAGKGDGSFGPDEAVTLDQAVTVCLRLLGWTDGQIGPFWPEDYLSKARKIGLLDGVDAADGQPLNRGQAALLLYNLLQADSTQGRTFALALGASAVADAALLDVDAQAPDGNVHTAKVYAGGKLVWYEQAAVVDASLVGRRGTLLLDQSGQVQGFLPDDSVKRTFTVQDVTAAEVTDANGNRYAIAANTPVVTGDETHPFSEVWYDLEHRQLTLYYAPSGSVTLAAASDAVAYQGTLLTGYYESASPNTAAPSSLTLLGHTFDVAEDAVGLASLKVDDKITISLNGAGEIDRAWSAGEKQAEVVAVLDNAKAGTFTHPSGLSLRAEITNTERAQELEGALVKLYPSGRGTCTVTAVAGGLSGSWDVAAGTLGGIPLADTVRVYDQVTGGPVVEIDIDDVLVDTVPASQITYAKSNANGQVDVLLLRDVTGDAYTYGICRYEAREGTTSAAFGRQSYTYHTISIEYSSGATPEATTGYTFRDDTPGGLALTAQGKVAGTATLTEAARVPRAAFDGDEFVTLDGVRVPIAANVQVYNCESETWLTLAQAKGYSDTLNVYYSGKPGKDAKVRVITVG